MSNTPNSRVLGPWSDQFPDLLKFLDGGGTKLLNVVGPSFTGKSTSMPFLVSNVVRELEVDLIYAVSTDLERERVLATCADVWRDNGVIMEMLTYRTLDQRLQATNLPRNVVIFIDVDPAASADYVLVWMRLAAMVGNIPKFKRRVVAISDAEIPAWHRAVFATCAKMDAVTMDIIHAPERELASVDNYTTHPLVSPPGGETEEERRIHRAVKANMTLQGQQNTVMMNFFASQGTRMLFVGTSYALGSLLQNTQPKDMDIPSVFEITEDADLKHVDKLIGYMAGLPSGERGVLCVHPGVRLSLSQAAKIKFTHVNINGPDSRGVYLHATTGNFVNHADIDEYRPEWELQRTLDLATQGQVLERSVVYCPRTPAVGGAGVEPGNKVPERQLYRQRDLYAFALRCVHLASDFEIDISKLIVDLDSGGGMDPRLWFDLTRRLITASLAHVHLGRFQPDQTDRAQQVCHWLPFVRNNVPAARILAGVEVVYKDLHLRRILIAMAVIMSHDDAADPLLSVSEMTDEMQPRELCKLFESFFSESQEIVDPKLGYMWCALSAWRWALVRGISPDEGEVPFAHGLLLVNLETADRMFAVADSIATELRIPLYARNGQQEFRPRGAHKTMQLHQELLCSGMDQLHRVTAAPGSAWSEVRADPATAVQVWDVVAGRKVAAGPTCRLVMVSAIPREGSFAVSTSPTLLGEGHDSFTVPNLTLIPVEAVRRWCQLHISDDTEEARDKPLNIVEMARSAFH
ncbi:hypothetical protein B0T11DRAFT_354206 [Plectosphaerella cucumerina]|uniref:Uncharacterized protein n=1 Tax=Plectosphaerella cucumerina TaxID=40658 RepID=A0A8K0TDU4_9PEZI|nr:hypothetical protein B0T11DRAFT_354206 [Plectosphaerella cucumerina]